MKIEYIYVDANTPTPDKYLNGFVEVYKEAFGGHPYYEVYTDSDVLNGVWIPHLADGIIVLACEGESVIGFICAMPLLKSPSEIQEFLRAKQLNGDFPVEFNDTWYISEIGVRTTHRRRGIGTQLIGLYLTRILEFQCHHYIMRTPVKDSNSIRIFKRIGSIELPEPQDVSNSKQVKIYKSQSTARVYLYRHCEEALEEIKKIQSAHNK